MAKRMVIYNGVKMTEDWPVKNEAAQSLTHYTVTGKKHARIRFGDEGHKGWGERPCRDCGVLKGQFHVPQCEYEKCPSCGNGFAGGCFCDIDELRGEGEEPIEPPGPPTLTTRIFTWLCWLILLVVGLALLRSVLMLFGI